MRIQESDAVVLSRERPRARARRWLWLAVAVLTLPAIAPAQDADGSWLVWVATDRGEITYEVAAAGTRVRVLGEVPGIHLGLGSERVELRRTEARATAWTCDGPRERPDPPREVRAFQLELVRTAGAVPIVPAPEMETNEEIDDALEIIATIGPYAVVRRRLWSQIVCAAHLYGGTHYLWIDLRSGAEIDVLGETPADPAIVAPVAERFLRRLVADGTIAPPDRSEREEERAAAAVAPFLDPRRSDAPAPSWVDGPDAPFHVTDVVPRWTDGRWLAHHRLEYWIGDCCESPEAFVDRGRPLPARFTPHVHAPTIVQRFLRRFPRASRLGFSRAP